MQITPIFSVGIGRVNEPSVLTVARQLFADNQEILLPGPNGLQTTLLRYNSTKDCAELNNQEAINTLKEVIRQNVIKYYAAAGYDVDFLDFEVVNLWLNEMESGASHEVHSHYGFQISGVFYVDVPQGSGLIKFYTPLTKIEHGDSKVKNYNQYNADYIGVNVQEGDMFFWESLLKHEVPPFSFCGKRRSIAYDVKICRKIDLVIPKKEFKMKLQDYVALYNINNPSLCKEIIQELEEDKWVKHSYNNPFTREDITYDDDLDISFQQDETTNKLQSFFEQCAKDYLNTFVPLPFELQNLTPIRFNRYKVGTNMKMHHDHIHTVFDGERRGVPILSMLALLNDDFEGGDFLMFEGKKVKLTAGDIIIFPSNFMYPHAVTTVTKGTRYSCVSWGY